MNTELFIARRIYKGDKQNTKRVSSPAIKIAIAGISLGLAVMIIAVCIMIGFKKEVREKVIGFGSHIQLMAFDSSSSYEPIPFAFSDTLANKLSSYQEITHYQPFITKPGVIKTESDFQGVVLKGVSETYDWDFFQKNMKSGNVIQTSDSTKKNQAIISQTLANKLHLKLGDAFMVYFVQDPVRVRKFNIIGIYETNFENYDQLFVVVPMQVLSKLNGYEQDMVSGVEVLIKDYNKLDEVARHLFFDMASHKDRFGNSLYIRSIKDINPMIFNWLSLLDMNVWFIIVLMITVSGFTMISGLLIIILERTNMIGILKSMGTRDFSIRKVFLYLSAFLIGQGMIWGNVIGLAFCLIQHYFHVIKLNPSTYYLTSVPVDINVLYILLLNIGTLAVSLLMMVGPSYLVARITPAKSIRFD